MVLGFEGVCDILRIHSELSICEPPHKLQNKGLRGSVRSAMPDSPPEKWLATARQSCQRVLSSP
jgi:hypothetical protein